MSWPCEDVGHLGSSGGFANFRQVADGALRSPLIVWEPESGPTVVKIQKDAEDGVIPWVAVARAFPRVW